MFDEEKHTRCRRWVLFREKMSHPVLLKKKEGRRRSRLHGIEIAGSQKRNCVCGQAG